MCDKNHSNCNHTGSSGVEQTLDEMDFERGIWYAAQHGDLDRVRVLLASGTPVDKLDSAGYTALHYAARNGHEVIVSELLHAGANINCTTRAGQATPLHRAASAGHSGIVNFLLSRNADTNILDADGKTVLHRAAEAQKLDICEQIIKKNTNIITLCDHHNKLPIDYVKPDNIRLYNMLIL